jgi:hypothetical protein
VKTGVCFDDGRGSAQSLPTKWTDLVAPDPFVAMAMGRALFRPDDLLELAALVRRAQQ